MKMLLKCNKELPYLYYNWTTDRYETTNSLKDLKGLYGGSRVVSEHDRYCAYQDNIGVMTNGHILAECDFNVEKIIIDQTEFASFYKTKSVSGAKLKSDSCMTNYDLIDYLGDKSGYAISVKNIHTFKMPLPFDKLWSMDKFGLPYQIESINQNMLYCHMIKPLELEYYVVVSISSEEMCRILNGEKTIVIRKKILKEMIN